MKWTIYILLLYTPVLWGQEYDWLRMSDEGPADTLFVRFDTQSIYMPLRFDDVLEDGNIYNMIHKLYDAKRDQNTVGVLFYYYDKKSDFANGVMYSKYTITQDSAWVINNGGYFSMYDSPTGTLPWRLVDASTIIVPNRDPSKTYIDYYTDEWKRYRYTCDTSQIFNSALGPLQRYPYPPPKE